LFYVFFSFDRQEERKKERERERENKKEEEKIESMDGFSTTAIQFTYIY